MKRKVESYISVEAEASAFWDSTSPHTQSSRGMAGQLHAAAQEANGAAGSEQLAVNRMLQSFERP